MNRTKTLVILIAAAFAATPVLADEREHLELLRQTTLNLIDALVESGALPKEKADGLLKAAEKKAAKAVREKTSMEPKPVRVQYVPETVKNEIREQLKQEVLAQAKNERWAEPNAVPEWLDRIKWEGDIRLRYQTESYPQGNTAAKDFDPSLGYGSLTRAADVGATNSFNAYTGNTEDDRSRLRLRARLGMLARVSDSWSAGIRLATGNSTDRVSTNQSLGQNFNKYQLMLDRAYLKYDPADWLSISGGRIPNPWYGMDVVWDEDINFEGLAATLKPIINLDAPFRPFLTVGAFPMRESSPPVANSRWIYGGQMGGHWNLGQSTNFKFGLAYYKFQGLEGHVIPNAEYDSLLNVYTSPDYHRNEYESGLRQKGNTLFATNALTDFSQKTIWGLASKFAPVVLSAGVDIGRFDPVHLVLEGEYAKNIAFDRDEISRRTGHTLSDGKSHAYQVRMTVGMPQLKAVNDWQVYGGYRYVGSDSVVDAFTDSDFGLGGTNLKGYFLGARYGVDRNAFLNIRMLSADTIDTPTLIDSTHKFGVDVIQADVNLRF